MKKKNRVRQNVSPGRTQSDNAGFFPFTGKHPVHRKKTTDSREKYDLFFRGCQGEKKRRRRALLTTETELRAMAPPAIIGFKVGPPKM